MLAPMADAREAGVAAPHADTELRAFFDQEMQRLAERPPELAFSRAEYAARLERLRSRMAADGLDLVILTAPDAMCWLHGYSSRWYRSNSSTQWPPVQCTLVHVDSDSPVLIETSSHDQLARLSSCVEDVRFIPDTNLDDWAAPLDDYVGFLVSELRAEGWLGGRVGLERWSSVPNPAVASVIDAALAKNGCEVVDATQTVRGVRRLKSQAEIEVIEQAQAVCDAGLLELQTNLVPGMTELEAWSLLMSGMIRAGGEPAAIHELVFAGPVPLGHSWSSRRAIERGAYFNADPCGVVHRYHSNAARPFFVGDPPAELVRFAEALGGVFEVIEATARVGMPFRELNGVLREYYEDSGIWGLNSWAGGYELGLSFPPDWVGEFIFSIDDDETDAVIESGLVTNFESVALIAMIDTLVFEDGGTRVLSSVPRQLLVVD
jgi:Xaa-Pro aminopeptidase